MQDKILEYVRISLYITAVIIAFFLYQAWQKEHPTPLPTEVSQSAAADANPGHFVPVASNAVAPSTATVVPQTGKAISNLPPSSVGKMINVKTDVLDVAIDTRGGDVVSTKLIQYKESLGSNDPLILMNDNPATRYIAESGLLSSAGPDTTQEQALYTTTQSDYALSPNQQDLTVRLEWEKGGIKIAKVFTFTRGSYEVKVGYDIDNQTTKPWTGNLYTQLLRTNSPPPSHGGFVNLATYFGAAISSPQKPFEKITFKQMKEKNLDQQITDGWAAMIQHYFISAWVPSSTGVSNYYSKVTPDGLNVIGMIGQPINVAPGAKVFTQAKLYTGPAIEKQLEKTAPTLKLTIDYGWLWFISEIIFWMLQHIFDVVGNWGWSIVIVTIIIKLLFYKLSAKSYRSMSVLKKLQPKIEQLKERFGDDKQKMTQATLDLYRTEKVNPMSGCLPILIQIPVFIALYWVLVESVQLRQAPFMFWIHDLSLQDPYYVLPVLMGISMFIQQRLNPPPPDPMQAKMMMMMPIIFTVLFANFPAGLMLYWFVNNTLSFMQQWYVMHHINKENVKS